MKVSLIAFALLALQPGAPRTVLDGRVVALGTDRPVAHATVVVARVGGTLEDYRTAITDAGGRFAFRDLAPGSYRVHAEREGYLRGEYGRRTAGGAGLPVVLTAGSSMPGRPGNTDGPLPRSTSIVVSMIQTGVIAGRVLDDGRPVRSILVRALRAGYRDGERVLTMVEYARTDDLGQYRLFGLAPGSYVVAAAPPPGPRIEGDAYVVPLVPSNANGNRREIRTALADALASGAVESSALEAATILPAFYPGTADEAAAVPIELRAGDVVTGIDLAVVRVSTSRVRGRVFTADGQPADGVQVSVRRPGGEAASVAGGAAVRAGEFELPALPRGIHELVTRTVTEYGTATVAVEGEDVEGVEIRLRRGTTVNGRMSVQDPPAGFPDRDPGVLTVQLVGRTLSTPGIRVGADGTFSVPNVHEGDYRLRVRYRRELLPISARFGTDDVRVRPVRIGPETAGLPLEIAVTLGTGALDATVLDAGGRPVAGTVVALVPDAPWRERSGLYHTATTDRDGRVSLVEVPPGDYSLFAGDVEPADWQNPDVLRIHDGRGERVTVRAGARHAVTLKVSP